MGLALGLGLIWAPVGCRGGGREAQRPNVILISIDSLRADHVHNYGYKRKTTPSLDRLAREGAAFEVTIAESSWTIPSHATMLTGVGSNVHGLQHGYVRLGPHRRTLAQILKEHGYRTAGVFSGPYLHPVFGFARGFDSYESVIEQPVGAEAISLANLDRETIDRLMEDNAASLRAPTSAAVTRKALDFLATRGPEPFFLFLYYFDPHYDYAPPEPFWRRFDPNYRGSFTGEDFIHNPDIRPNMNRRDLRHLIARYDGEILYTDLHVGRLIESLDRNGLSENTLVIVTADHGEEFFEHENRGHRRTLFDEVLKVPLIVRLPGRVPAGTRVDRLVRHVDIAPTILSFAGVQEPLQGNDLTDLLTGAASTEHQVAVSRLIRTLGKNEWVSVRGEDFKYVRRQRADVVTELLFDLRADPGEQSPLILRTTRTRDHGAWTAFDAAQRELVRQGEAEAREAVALEAGEAGLPDELADQLEALGYIQ